MSAKLSMGVVALIGLAFIIRGVVKHDVWAICGGGLLLGAMAVAPFCGVLAVFLMSCAILPLSAAMS